LLFVSTANAIDASLYPMLLTNRRMFTVGGRAHVGGNAHAAAKDFDLVSSKNRGGVSKNRMVVLPPIGPVRKTRSFDEAKLDLTPSGGSRTELRSMVSLRELIITKLW
jgi:hypothetical protein